MVTRGSPKPLFWVRVLVPLPPKLSTACCNQAVLFCAVLTNDTSHLLQCISEEMDIYVVSYKTALNQKVNLVLDAILQVTMKKEKKRVAAELQLVTIR